MPLSLLRTATLAAWVTRQEEPCGRLLAELQQRDPADALSRLLQIAEPVAFHPDTAGDGTQLVQTLDASLRWLLSQDPDLPRELQQLGVAQLIYQPPPAAVVAAARQQVVASQHLSQVTPWIPLLQLLGDRSAQQELLQTGSRLLAADRTAATAADLRALVGFALAVHKPADGPFDAAALDLWEACLVTADTSPPPVAAPPPLRGTDRTGAEILSLLRQRADQPGAKILVRGGRPQLRPMPHSSGSSMCCAGPLRVSSCATVNWCAHDRNSRKTKPMIGRLHSAFPKRGCSWTRRSWRYSNSSAGRCTQRGAAIFRQPGCSSGLTGPSQRGRACCGWPPSMP